MVRDHESWKVMMPFQERVDRRHAVRRVNEDEMCSVEIDMSIKASARSNKDNADQRRADICDGCKEGGHA